MMQISYDWHGYILNHLLMEDHPHYRDGDRFPGDINWKTDTRVPLIQRAIDLKFLWIAKVFYLHHDPDTEEELATPIPVVLEKYNYGTWQLGIPEKQDKRAFFYQTAEEINGDFVLSLAERSRFIPRNRSTITEREVITVNRRTFALNYLKGRAKEIDIATGGSLALEAKIKSFFDTFDVEVRTYMNYASHSIFDVLVSAPDEWLDMQLPDLGTIRAELIRVLSEAIEIPTMAEIEAKITAETV